MNENGQILTAVQTQQKRRIEHDRPLREILQDRIKGKGNDNAYKMLDVLINKNYAMVKAEAEKTITGILRMP